ncbi:EF-hand domain-containing protein [Bdellovibrio sp. 22V]|uniref:EF-hand domain-containing protein n=1 Tax=Bdellovibrio TaxID=958 RepID=UPI0025434BBC|nr:EF-hand domain-containing protein [Bdellovibrio sp. 22V]WII71577.1 EF-hand domain-containing protein [Bdellovibrio sp. 22V]
MGKSIKSTSLLALLLALGSSSYAAESDKDFPMSVNSTTSGETVISAPATGLVTRSGKATTIVKINNSCFGTNLRGVGNPVAPTAIIKGDLVVNIGGKSYPMSVEYPAALVAKGGLTSNEPIRAMDPDKFKINGGGSAAIWGNSVILRTPIPAGVTVDSSGNIAVSADRDVYLESYSFSQIVTECGGPAVYGAYGYSSYTATTNCGDYMGKNGPLSVTFGGVTISPDKSNVDINVSFPGQTGFCGGYWSPLMVFFDDNRPTFANTTDFPLNPMGRTSWPEANAPGWFVALDRDHSGKIDKKDELFGDNASEENGFEVLKKFDSNGDGFIDKKDKEFKKLVLWNDKNGDGVSQKEELVALSKKVMKISLNYEKGIVQPIGQTAEARERSKFWWKEKGKVREGQVVDIWLAPVNTKLSQR